MPIYAAMLLIAGAALGLWSVIHGFGPGNGRWETGRTSTGGSSVGFRPGRLLFAWDRRYLLVTARRRRWGVDRLLWFAHGMAAWLLWPPIVYKRINTPAEFGSQLW